MRALEAKEEGKLVRPAQWVLAATPATTTSSGSVLILLQKGLGMPTHFCPPAAAPQELGRGNHSSAAAGRTEDDLDAFYTAGLEALLRQQVF